VVDCIRPTLSSSRVEDAQENIMKLVNRLKSFVRNEEAQDLIEYAMLVALIALFCVGAVTFAGGQVSAVFNSITSALPS
jgi:pilus assembly protein Flp/PilA